MRSIDDEMPNLKRLVQMLAAQFGSNTEVVLHDLSRDYRHTIVAIENNHVTGRNIGDGGTNLGLEVLRNPPNKNGDIYNYFNKTADGRMLRSSTLYFRDGQGRVIGSLCINTDITRMVEIRDTLGEIAMIPGDKDVEEVFANNVEELFEYFIKHSKVIVDKPSSEMTKEDRIEVIRYLDSKGFFLITRAGDEACKFLGISKYTLYKYLGIVRERSGDAISEADEPE
ncbi:MAG: helix-turn-helix transcriptional regulator [Spirochaetaceae bacterium]|jgi:predicted transcriptional regulator YheO|nr:helix-turn-helix transcriptional regulator [Spirochaetaceae bacterium]